MNYVVNETTGNDYAGISLGDLDMRPDGRLFTYAGINTVGGGSNGNAGRVAEVDTGDGTFVQQSNDAIANRTENPTSWQTNTNNVLSFAFDLNAGDSNVGEKYEELYLIIQDGNRSKLYRAADGGGVADGGVSATSNQPLAQPSPPEGYRGAIEVRRDVEGNYSPTGDFTDDDLLVTGLQFQGENGQLVGVSADGLLLQGINPAGRPSTTEQATEFFTQVEDVVDLSSQLPFGATGFTGLATAPRNLAGGLLGNEVDGYYSSMFVATTDNGHLVFIDTNAPRGSEIVFIPQWTDAENLNGQTSLNLGLGGTTGVAVSPLDINLWHRTDHRGSETGHGIIEAPDGTRRLEDQDRYYKITTVCILGWKTTTMLVTHSTRSRLETMANSV